MTWRSFRFDMSTSRVPSAPLRRKLSWDERLIRRFILFAWRVRFGWLLVLALGAGAMWMSHGLFAAFPHLQKPVHPQVLAICLLWFAFICFGLFFGMLRRALRGPTLLWDQLPRV